MGNDGETHRGPANETRLVKLGQGQVHKLVS